MKYMDLNRKELGKFGEELAAEYLAQKDIFLVAKNYRCRQAEIDLIALDGDELVFVEVKTRRSLQMGPGILAIDARKIQKIRLCIADFLHNHHFPHRSIRIDAVDILLTEGHPPSINHLRAVS